MGNGDPYIANASKFLLITTRKVHILETYWIVLEALTCFLTMNIDLWQEKALSWHLKLFL